MSMDDTTISSATTWAAYSAGDAAWGEWVEARLAERLDQERAYGHDFLAEVIAHLSRDLRDEWTKMLASLRAQRSLEVAGTYDGSVKYRALDVVALNGASFVARIDDPKQCPGADWQLIAAQGKKGAPGRDGTDGKAGKDAPRITGWVVDAKNYVATPIMSDGSRAPPLELRGLFVQYDKEKEAT
jgi:hypothetical protein